MDKSTLDKIFKTYDIRGLIGVELDNRFFFSFGIALSRYLNAKKVAVGRDIRISSPEFSHSLIKGLTSQGTEVYDIGEVPTEAIYFIVGEHKYLDAALAVTASHNPKEYNGIKVVGKEGISIDAKNGFPKLKKLTLEAYNSKDSEDSKAKVEKMNILEHYKRKVLSFINPKLIKPMHLVIDPGNGIGGRIFDMIFGDLSLKVTKLHYDVIPSLPNHAANPMIPDNTSDLRKLTREKKADLGIAYDTDADRVAFVDKQGRIANGYYMGNILAKHFLNRKKGETIVHDNRLVTGTRFEVKKLGGKDCMVASGRTSIRRAMEEKNAIFGFEASSHFFYKDYYFWDSAMVTTAILLEILSQGETLEELHNYYFGNYPTSQEINYMTKNPKKLFGKLKDKFSDSRISQLDGISIEYDDWRFNLRKSNTQPLVRLNIEADTPKLVKEKVELLDKFITDNL